MFVWTDYGRDVDVSARQAANRDSLLAPGTLFSPVSMPSRMLRFSVAVADNQKFGANWKNGRRYDAQAGAELNILFGDAITA